MRHSPEISWSLQSKYLIIFIAAVVCAFWMRFEPNFTFACMGAGVFFFLLSRLPLNWFPSWLRQILQIGLAAMGVYWVQGRLGEIPMDTCFIELTAILLPGLFLGGTMREHNLLWLGCLGLTGYGGMFPARSAFLSSFLVVVAGSILVLYQTRIALLARLGGKNLVPHASPRYFSNWLYRMEHFALVVLLVFVFSTQFSLRNKSRSIGLIPVSFRVDQEQDFPELWQDWAAPTKEFLLGGKSGPAADSPRNPTVSDNRAKNRMPANALASAENGDGSGIGEDLVFRAFTPAKLYWVMQIYDTYDGQEWSRSPTLCKGRSALDKYTSAYHSEVVQNITIVKAVSRYLPYAQRAMQVIWNDGNSDGIQNMGVIRREDSVSYQLRNETLPPLPWKYTVLSTVPDVELSHYIRPWREPPRNFGWNYRQLPRKVISARMMDLARDITESADTPHQKALALRDYLRQNFTYNLSPPKPPPGQELSDFFLFESREGFCQHYAQAFTLLARMAGLHSRLVTGYSPGNFNLLANCFEVYEYHGHAWVQIFIEPFGWLTFDGTPPGEMRLEDTPPLLKPLLDPFGEKWKVQTPELSARSPVPSKPSLTPGQAPPRQPKKPQSNKQQSVLQQKVLEAYNEIYAKAVADNSTFSPEAKHILKAAAQTLKSKMLAFWQQAMESLQALANALAMRILDGVTAVLNWLAARTLADLMLLILLVAVAGLGWKLRRRCWNYLLWRWRMYRCIRDWQRIAARKMDGRVRIEACQKLVSEMLGLIGLRRQPQRDLLEYTEIILQRLPALADDYAFIASTAAETWYSTHLPDENLADAVFAATKHFFQTIRPHLRRRNFLKAQA